MGNFEAIVLWHAIFVALTYAMLAYGASVYRRIVDNIAERSVRLGEDVHFGYDPLVVYCLGVLGVVDIAFVYLVVFIFPEAEVQYYVIPLAMTINITQIAHRMHYQRLQIKTLGLVGKNIFAEDFQLIPFSELYLVEVERDSLWNTVTFHIAHIPDHQYPATATYDTEPLPLDDLSKREVSGTEDHSTQANDALPEHIPSASLRDEDLQTFRRRMSAQMLAYTLDAVRLRSSARIVEEQTML
jgi:hypothetical protein